MMRHDSTDPRAALLSQMDVGVEHLAREIANDAPKGGVPVGQRVDVIDHVVSAVRKKRARMEALGAR